MPLASHIDPEVGVRLQHKMARMFSCSYIDPATCLPTPTMTFGSSDEFQVWNEGAPPFPGWWNAHYNLSDTYVLEMWRWWDGEQWSPASHSSNKNPNINDRGFKAKRPDLYKAIKWNDRWPVGARVPRLIPEGHPLQPYAWMIGGASVAEPVDDAQLALPLEDKPLQQQLEESDW